ncbi:MAG: hypothetical protein R6X25_10675 [Candidatus Krumholzibacteriia bacterium]
MKITQYCSVCKQSLDMEIVPTGDGDDDGVIWLRCPQCEGFLPKISGEGFRGVAPDPEGSERADEPVGRTGEDVEGGRASGDASGDTVGDAAHLPGPGPSSDDQRDRDERGNRGHAEDDDAEDGDAEDGDAEVGRSAAAMARRERWEIAPAGDSASGASEIEPRDRTASPRDRDRPRDRRDRGADAGAADRPEDTGVARGAEEQRLQAEWAARLAECDPGDAQPYRPWNHYEVGDLLHHLAWDDCGLVVEKETLPGSRQALKVYFADRGIVRFIEADRKKP